MIIKRLKSCLRNSLEIVRSNYKIIVIGILAEMLFFLSWGFFAEPLLNYTKINLIYLGDAIVSESPNLSMGIIGIIRNSNDFRNIVILLLVLAFITYLLYCLFHGFIWGLCLYLRENGRYFTYIKRFFAVNVFWYILFVSYVIIDFLFYYLDTISKRFYSGGFILSKITFLLLLLILYFAFISYVLISRYGVWKSIKESFRIGARPLWLAAYLIVLLSFFAANYLLVIIGKLSLVLGNETAYIFVIGIGIIIVMPMMIWMRIFIKEIVDAV